NKDGQEIQCFFSKAGGETQHIRMTYDDLVQWADDVYQGNASYSRPRDGMFEDFTLRRARKQREDTSQPIFDRIGDRPVEGRGARKGSGVLGQQAGPHNVNVITFGGPFQMPFGHPAAQYLPGEAAPAALLSDTQNPPQN